MMDRTSNLWRAGYRVIEARACEKAKKLGENLPSQQTRTYQHVILYDFESYGDKNRKKEQTSRLTFESVHVLVSVSVGDTLEREPTHICEKEPAELVRKFMEELGRRGKNIREKVWEDFMPGDPKMLPQKQRKKMEEWCNEMPVVGFYSGTYSLNLIREHFA